MTHRSLIALLLLVHASAGCYVPLEDGLPEGESGDRFRSFHGLGILAEKTWINAEKELETETKFVDLSELYVTAFSQCKDNELNEESDHTMSRCTDEHVTYTGQDPCLHAYCRARILNCTGHQALALAGAVDVTTIQAKPFAWVHAEDADGIWFELPSKDKLPEVTFRIPPLSGPVKTLAYLAAHGAFRRAGLYAADMYDLRDASGGKTCLQYISSLSDASVQVTHLDQYVMTFTESMAGLVESAKLLANNQRNAATASLATNADGARAQKALWESKLNSHAAAIRLLVGDPDENISMPGCQTTLVRPAHKEAAKLLRVARLANTFNESVGISELIDQTIRYLAPDLLDPNTEVPLAGARATLLSRWNVAESDFILARKHLVEERAAVGLPPDMDPELDPEDSRRLATLTPLSGTRSGAYFMGRAMSQKVLPASTAADPLVRRREELRSFAQLGALHALDYMRDIADQLLVDQAAAAGGWGTGLLLPEHEQSLMSGSALAASTMGKRRMVVVSPTTSERHILRYGEKGTGEFFLVRGEKGYRCWEEGSIHGAPCKPEDHRIKLSTKPEFVPAPIDQPRKTLADHWLITVTDTDLGSGGTIGVPRTDVFLFENMGTGRPRLVGFFRWGAFRFANQVLYQPAIAGSALDLLIQDCSTRRPGQCSEPKEMCGDLGIPRDYVPNLENEIMESLANTDNYENSWVHYLNTAREASARADDLGEKLVLAGLEQDARAELAQREIERICGGVINFPPPPGPENRTCDTYDANCDVVQAFIDQEENAALKNCLPSEYGGGMERIPYATAGSRAVCIHQNRSTKAICDDDAPKPCPLMLEGATTEAACREAFGNVPSTHDVMVVDRTLNIFKSTDPGREVTTGTCDQDLFFLSLAILGEDKDDKEEIIKGLLETMPWIERPFLSRISSQIGLDIDILYHYTMTFGNQTLWTTRVIDKEGCPLPRPWSQWTPASAQPIACVRGNSASLEPLSSEDHGLWLADELLTEDSHPGYAWTRQQWGDDTRQQIMALALLTGAMGDVRQAGWWLRQADYDDIPTVLSGDMSPGLFMRAHETSWADEPLVCLINKAEYDAKGVFLLRNDWRGDPEHFMSGDANIAPCSVTHTKTSAVCGRHNYGKFRFEYSLGYEVKYGPQHLNDFWIRENLAAFLAGKGPTGDLWKLHSHYTYDIQVKGRTNADGINELVFEVQQRDTGWAKDHNCERALPRPFADVITPERFLEALDLACSMGRRSNDIQITCDAADPDGVPQVNSKRDLKKLEAYTRCAANDIQRIAERIIIPNLPEVLVRNFQTNAMEGLYGEFGGENLKALVAIEDSLRALGTAGSDISRVLSDASGHINKISIELESVETQKIISGLQTMTEVIKLAIQSLGSLTTDQAMFGASAATQALAAFASALTVMIGIYEQKLHELKEQGIMVDAMLLFSNTMRELTGVFNNIQSAYSNIQAQLATLDQNQAAAASWWAQGMGLDSDLAGRVFPVNTTMRRRMNTLRHRYEEAFLRARKLAFIARRAIELRLGVEMPRMHDGMTLVPPPASWADRVCDMQGFSYDRLRDAYPEDPLLDPELQESDSYAHWYIGDYVTLLGDFVTSYNLDHPMTDERDIAVISVRDDLMRARRQCEVPSRNMLYYSDDVGRSSEVEDQDLGVTQLVGWNAAGCNEDPGQLVIGCVPNDTDPEDPLTCLAPDLCVQALRDVPESAHCVIDGFCFENDTTRFFDLDSPDLGVWPHPAERLRDRGLPASETEITGRTDAWRNSGYYEQVIPGLTSGDYLLSWWAKLPPGGQPPDVDPPRVAYKVELMGTVGSSPPRFEYVGYPPSDWERIHLDGAGQPIWIRLTAPQDVIVRIHPSAAQDGFESGPLGEFGDFLIWGMQLERVRCPATGCPPSPDPNEPNPLTPEPGIYQATGADNTVAMANCPDLDGSVMRRHFVYKCICLGFPNGVCPQGSEGASYRKCFYEYPFMLLLDRIETSDLIPSNNIAIGNFNYRHEAMAVNVVGTNVIECTSPEAPSSCYTNAFMPYTLELGGWVQIRNHDRETVEFNMPTARVEHGKGLAAEVVITNPLTGTHSQLLSEFWKDGLRGRPLQGEYMLRIWDSPNLVWSRVEDIQLVWKYRYWTSLGASY